MPCVFVGELLTFKYVAQVSAASAAHDFNPSPVGISLASNGTRNLIVEAGPAATGREFIIASIQRRFALSAVVRAGFFVVLVFPSVGSFGAFVDDDPRLFRREIIEFRISHFDEAGWIRNLGRNAATPRSSKGFSAR